MKTKRMVAIFIATMVTMAMLIGVSVGAVLFPVPAGTGDIKGDQYPWSEDSKAQVSAKFIAEHQSQTMMGFDVGSPHGGDLVHTWAGIGTFVSQNHSGGDSIGAPWGIPGLAIIMMASEDHPAFTIRDYMINEYNRLGDVGTVGAPLSNQFVFGGDLYQKFTEFYIKIASGATQGGAFHFDQADEIGLVVPLEAQGADMAKIGEPLTEAMILQGDFGWATGKVVEYANISVSDAKSMFQNEYLAQLVSGFDLGIPDPENVIDGYVHFWTNGVGDTFIVQNFRDGDSTAAVWGLSNIAMLFLCPEEENVFTLKSEMMTAFGEGGITDLGTPVSNEFEFEGSLYQWFYYNTFIKITDGVAEIIDEDDIEYLVIPASAMGLNYEGADIVIGSAPEPTPVVTVEPTPVVTVDPTPVVTADPTTAVDDDDDETPGDVGVIYFLGITAMSAAALIFAKKKR